MSSSSATNGIAKPSRSASLPKGQPNPAINYAQRFNDYRERYERGSANQKAYKEALAKSSSKQIKLQDEIDYLLDALGAARASRRQALGLSATEPLGPAPGAKLRSHLTGVVAESASSAVATATTPVPAAPAPLPPTSSPKKRRRDSEVEGTLRGDEAETEEIDETAHDDERSKRIKVE